jgi:uncharacterized protein (TIGR03000 family)
MNLTPRRTLLPALLLPALLLLTAVPAAAQIVLDGGRIVVGSPPPEDYYKHYTGHGNYPGGYGFTPGYGYYPYYSDGPDWPPLFRHRRGGAPAGPAVPDVGESLPPTCAVLDLRVPDSAEVWFSGQPTAQRGGQRRFVTPPLAPEGVLVYDLRVRWDEGGRPVERNEVVRVYPGDRRTLDLRAPAARSSSP